MIWGFPIPSEVGSQATQTIPETTATRQTPVTFIVGLLMLFDSYIFSPRLYPSLVSSCKLVLISLTSVPKSCIQIFATRILSSCGCKDRRGIYLVVSWGQRIVDKRRGHWNEDALDHTCRLDEVLVEINLARSERFIRWSVSNYCFEDQLLWYYEIWLNLALGEYFTSRFVGKAHRTSVFFILVVHSADRCLASSSDREYVVEITKMSSGKLATREGS